MGMWRFILGFFFCWQKISRIISQEEVCVAAKDGGVHSRTSFTVGSLSLAKYDYGPSINNVSSEEREKNSLKRRFTSILN